MAYGSAFAFASRAQHVLPLRLSLACLALRLAPTLSLRQVLKIPPLLLLLSLFRKVGTGSAA